MADLMMTGVENLSLFSRHVVLFFIIIPRRIRNLFAIKFDIFFFTSKYRISSVIIRSVMIADNKYNTDL